MAEYVLELKNIGKTFSGVNVLRNINMSLIKGEVHALLGENGAGKSTLIKIISGYHQPDPGGKIFINGKEVVFRNPKDAMDAHIHTIYQELTLCKDMTVAENIVIDKQDKFKGIITDNKVFCKLAEDTLKRLGSDINPHALVRSLSIAQQQVVEIAKAISANADVILMDEPTSSISERDASKLMDIIRKLRDDGVSIIYISHRLHEIREIADRVTVLRDGDMVGTVDVATTTTQDYVNMMVGREMSNAFPKTIVELGEVVLKVEDLSTDVFSGVSFEVREGEIFGIGGLVGAKRTEILEAIFGLRPITGGRIWLFGKEYMPSTPKDAIKRGMAFATEDRKKSGLVLCLPVIENINMVNLHDIVSNKRGVVSFKKCIEVAHRMRQALNIRLANMDQAVSTLSGGNQQKVVLSKWLEMDPKIILFDEPTRGIDIGAKSEIYTIMGELVKKGVAIVMVSSELPELISVTDEIAVMCEGKLMGVVPHEEATQERIMTLASASL